MKKFFRWFSIGLGSLAIALALASYVNAGPVLITPHGVKPLEVLPKSDFAVFESTLERDITTQDVTGKKALGALRTPHGVRPLEAR